MADLEREQEALFAKVSWCACHSTPTFAWNPLDVYLLSSPHVCVAQARLAYQRSVSIPGDSNGAVDVAATAAVDATSSSIPRLT